MYITPYDKQDNVKSTSGLFVLTTIYFFYGFFEPYLNQIIGPVMRFYIIVLILFYMFQSQFILKKNYLMRNYIFWFLLLCVSLLWARDYEIFKTHFFSLFGTILLLICITNYDISDIELNRYIYTVWIGSFLVGFLSLFMHSAYRESFTSRQVLTIFGVQTDPNNQACFLLFGVFIALYYLTIKKEKLIISTITIVVNTISMMMTSSRGGVTSLVSMVLIILLFIIRNGKTRIWTLFGIAVICVILYRYAGNYVGLDSIQRLVSLDEYEGGGHRIEIWKSALQLMNQNPLYYIFGAGWGSYYGYNGWLGMHNTYLETLCNSGLIGFSFFYYPIIKSIFYLWKREDYLPIFIIFPILIASFFLDSINKRYFWYAIFFLFIFYFKSKKKENERTKQFPYTAEE